MDVYPCPKGHQSSEADFCSECGAKIAGSEPAAPVPPPKSAGPVCPDCGAPRHAEDVVFCEVCGFNFATGAHGEIPMPAVAVSPPVPAEAPSPKPAEAPSPKPTDAAPNAWNVIVSVDPGLREPGSPEPPSSVAPFPVALDKPVSLIGRRSDTRAIDPEIPLDFDEAVSHRHAVLNRASDGSLAVRDIGSSNGTSLNGAAVPPMIDTPLRDGDQITLGHWTRITVKAV